jgi:hypothetical protein
LQLPFVRHFLRVQCKQSYLRFIRSV